MITNIMRHMNTGMIWICSSSHTNNCVFHFLLEVGAERKTSKLGTSTLELLKIVYWISHLINGPLGLCHADVSVVFTNFHNSTS